LKASVDEMIAHSFLEGAGGKSELHRMRMVVNGDWRPAVATPEGTTRKVPQKTYRST